MRQKISFVELIFWEKNKGNSLILGQKVFILDKAYKFNKEGRYGVKGVAAYIIKNLNVPSTLFC